MRLVDEVLVTKGSFFNPFTPISKCATWMLRMNTKLLLPIPLLLISGVTLALEKRNHKPRTVFSLSDFTAQAKTGLQKGEPVAPVKVKPKLSEVEQERINSRLINAASNGNIEEVKESIDAGAQLDAGVAGRENALTQAACNGHTEVIKLLLANGADVDAKNLGGCTALIETVCAFFSEPESIKLLLEKGANVNAKADDGSTALIWSAARGRTEIEEILLSNGADVNAKTDDGNTALSVAAHWGKADTVKLLLLHQVKACSPTEYCRDYAIANNAVEEVLKRADVSDATKQIIKDELAKRAGEIKKVK